MALPPVLKEPPLPPRASPVPGLVGVLVISGLCSALYLCIAWPDIPVVSATSTGPSWSQRCSVVTGPGANIEAQSDPFPRAVTCPLLLCSGHNSWNGPDSPVNSTGSPDTPQHPSPLPRQGPPFWGHSPSPVLQTLPASFTFPTQPC